MEALRRMGVDQPAKHFIVLSDGPIDEGGVPVTVLAKKTPFTAGEESLLKLHISSNPPLSSVYLQSETGQNAFSRLIQSGNPQEFAAGYVHNVAPVTDNSPFFFFTAKLPGLMHGLYSMQSIDWKANAGLAALAIVMVVTFLAVLAFLIAPLLALPGRCHPSFAALAYFFAVGAGYMLVEMACIQRFVLFLGHPTYALTVVVFLLLLGSGAGSLASQRWLASSRQNSMTLIAIVLLLLVHLMVVSRFCGSLIGLSTSAKILLSIVVLFPLGFLMGIPFPTGLRLMAMPSRTVTGPANKSLANANAVEWAWAVNAGASVMGSCLAVAIGISYGLTATYACGAAAYCGAWIFSALNKRSAAV